MLFLPQNSFYSFPNNFTLPKKFDFLFPVSKKQNCRLIRFHFFYTFPIFYVCLFKLPNLSVKKHLFVFMNCEKLKIVANIIISKQEIRFSPRKFTIAVLMLLARSYTVVISLTVKSSFILCSLKPIEKKSLIGSKKKKKESKKNIEKK